MNPTEIVEKAYRLICLVDVPEAITSEEICKKDNIWNSFYGL